MPMRGKRRKGKPREARGQRDKGGSGEGGVVGSSGSSEPIRFVVRRRRC